MARELSAKHPDQYFYADQYSNEANWKAHYHGTANEIWQQTQGRITHFVSMLGTSGTFVGTTRRLKELNPAVQCISLQPDSSFHGIEGAKHMASAIVPKTTITDLATRRSEISKSRRKMLTPWPRQLWTPQCWIAGRASPPQPLSCGCLKIARDSAAEEEKVRKQCW
jgi:cysteine synthase